MRRNTRATSVTLNDVDNRRHHLFTAARRRHDDNNHRLGSWMRKYPKGRRVVARIIGLLVDFCHCQLFKTISPFGEKLVRSSHGHQSPSPAFLRDRQVVYAVYGPHIQQCLLETNRSSPPHTQIRARVRVGRVCVCGLLGNGTEVPLNALM